MKKIFVLIALAVSTVCFGHHHCHGGWGRGGSHFWPGFVGGFFTGTVLSRPVYATPVVTTPVVAAPVASQVWIPGHWQCTYDQYGNVVSRFWVSGHYEVR